MMSLTNVSLSKVVFQQYRYKLRSYIGVFLALIIVQLLGIFIATNGTANSGFSNGYYSIDIASFSSDVVIVFTMIWAFMNAILITTKAYREDDFTFVSNRLSYNLSNIAFIVTASVIGAVTALLSNGLVQFIVYFTSDINLFLTLNQQIGIIGHAVTVISTILFVLLAGTAGYLIGMMVQVNKLFILLIPILIAALNYIDSSSSIFGYADIIKYFFSEPSFPLFVAKTVLAIIICYGLAIFLSNRLEVRR
jgi:hypothetical protein